MGQFIHASIQTYVFAHAVGRFLEKEPLPLMHKSAPHAPRDNHLAMLRENTPGQDRTGDLQRVRLTS